MKILFVVDSLSDLCGANVNIVRTLTRQFKNRGYEISVLSKSDCKRSVSERIAKEFDHIYLLRSDDIEIFPAFKLVVDEKSSRLKQNIWMIKHPGIFFKGIDIVFLGASFTKREFTREISQICKHNDIDAIIGVSAPYYISEAVSQSDIGAVKAVYQLDPYTNNYTLLRFTKAWRRHIERRTIKNLDVLFLPNFVKEDMIGQKILETSSKILEVNLPGIIAKDIGRRVIEKKKVSLDKNIVFLFAGKFYKNIRNPGYLLELFCCLPQNYSLHIVGCGCEKIIDSYREKLKKRLIHHGYVGKSEADRYTKNADILINVDNSIRNQMPSKVLDYISQGKRIVNICKDKECLSAKLLENYSNGINVYEEKKSIEDNAECIDEFVKQDAKQITSKEVLKMYWKYTDQYVAETIAASLEKLVNSTKIKI